MRKITRFILQACRLLGVNYGVFLKYFYRERGEFEADDRRIGTLPERDTSKKKLGDVQATFPFIFMLECSEWVPHIHRFFMDRLTAIVLPQRLARAVPLRRRRQSHGLTGPAPDRSVVRCSTAATTPKNLQQIRLYGRNQTIRQGAAVHRNLLLRGTDIPKTIKNPRQKRCILK